MAFEHDGFARYKPVKGQVASSAQPEGLYWQATFIASLAAALNNANAGWKIEESEDGTTFVVAADPALFRAPATGTSTAFHCSTASKAPFVRATLMDGAAPAAGASYVVLLGKPDHGPFGPEAGGVEDGIMAPN